MPNYKSNNFFVEGGKLHLPGVDKASVRVTPGGRVSVYDFIKVVGQQKNPWMAWDRITDRYPELLRNTEDFKFPGKGQRKTPVIDNEGLQILQEIVLAANGTRLLSDNEKAHTSNKFYPRVEAQILSVLLAAFPDANPCPQFFCCGYYIDLYLSKHRIAVECDENDHQRYCPKKEAKRERTIKGALGCSFVRFNPYDADFNVGNVIFSVRQLINEAGRNDQHRHPA